MNSPDSEIDSSRNNSKDSVMSNFLGQSMSPIENGLSLQSSQLLGVEIIEYIEGNDANSYDNHIFVIRVNVGQLCYNINRTYSSFCELDARLRRKFARCPIPFLPLADGRLFVKRATIAIKSPSSFSPSLIKAETLRESMTSPNDDDIGYASDGGSLRNGGFKHSSIKRRNKNEVIGQKKGPLNYYLQQLLSLPEVLTSETFCLFIDPDPDYQYGNENHEEVDISDLDILLAKEKRQSKLIIRKLIVPIEVLAGSIIVYSFETKNHDIGFSVSFNDIEIVQYQRYNSHISTISSCFEVVENGNLKLHWDNSYSKLRSKSLGYIIKVFNKIEYQKAHKLALEVKNEKRLISQQRQFLKRALIKVANNNNNIEGPQKLILLNFRDCDVINSSTKNKNNDNSNNLDLKDISTLESEIAKLKDEKISLQKALALSESLLIQEKEQNQLLEDNIDDLNILNKSRLDEIMSLTSTINDLKKEKDALMIQNAVSNTNTIMNTRRESLESSSLKYQYIIEDLQNKLNDATTNTESLESQLTQLKLEKKKLRNFCLQLKSQLDIYNRNKNNNNHNEDNNINIVDENIEKKSENNDDIDNDNINTNNDIIDDEANDNNYYNDGSNDNNSSNIVNGSNDSFEKESEWRVFKKEYDNIDNNNNNNSNNNNSNNNNNSSNSTSVDSKGKPILTEVKRDSLWF